MNSVYIHIPFCENICSYCAFCKQYYNDKIAERYLDILKEEINEKYQGDLIKTIYIGGGTPSVLSKKLLEKLFDIIKIFKLTDDAEFTIEVNPESITDEKLRLFIKNKVNRISIGIESTNNRILKYLNRSYTYLIIKEKIELIKKYFQNISVDLMYAIPGETLQELQLDLQNIIDLNVKHISTYSLMIEEHTKLYIQGINPVSEDLDYEMYQLIIRMLTENGFIHYEVSNFGKEKFFSKHNLNYWHNKSYYGFGLNASGYIRNIRYTNTKSMSRYLNKKYGLEEEQLTIDDIISYELILGFRLVKGINKNDFYLKYHRHLTDLYNITSLIKKKDLIDDGTNIYINYDKLYIENSILINFVGEE